MPLVATKRWSAIAGLLAGPWFAVALLAFAARVPEYRHALHPPALLGASGMPDALAWNLLGFLVPGVLAAIALQALHGALRAAGQGSLARIGATVLLLSALAFAGQGMLPLRLGQAIDAGAARLHVMLWMAWWLSALAGWVLLAVGMRRRRALVAVTLLAAIGMGIALHAQSVPLPGGMRERIALAAWFGWIALASAGLLRLSRSAASSPG